MLWQQVSSFWNHFGFLVLFLIVMVCRNPAGRAVFIKLATLWAILLGLLVDVVSAMTIHQDHLLSPGRWGHHGFRELMLTAVLSIFGLTITGLGFVSFRQNRANPHQGLSCS